jgi:hypothetical protein
MGERYEVTFGKPAARRYQRRTRLKKSRVSVDNDNKLRHLQLSFYLPLEQDTSAEVKLVVSSGYACACRSVRILGDLCTRLFIILACYLGIVALSGGYVANGLATAMNATQEPIPQYSREHGFSLSALSCSHASVTGSGSDNCTVTLTAAAGTSGLTVNLASSNAAVIVPAKLVIPANAKSAVFAASVLSVTSAQTVTLTASANRVSKSFALHLNAAATTVPTLSISPTSVAFGNVTVDTASKLPVTLTSTGSAPVTVNSATLSGTGFTMSGATFPVTLDPSLAVTLEVQFDPTAAGAAMGWLTIQSNSSANSSLVISLSGAGETAAQHQVDLSWSAPSSSTVPIVGYNIYRSTGGGAAYQLLNSSVDAQTTYVDGSVQAGSTYDYIVESVGSSGTESVPSNEVTASIP